jgi:hypothetical protein
MPSDFSERLAFGARLRGACCSAIFTVTKKFAREKFFSFSFIFFLKRIRHKTHSAHLSTISKWHAILFLVEEGEKNTTTAYPLPTTKCPHS